MRETQIKMEEIPATLEEAVEELKSREGFSTWASLPEDRACSMVHRVTGMKLRNEWGLWGHSCLWEHLSSRFGLTHPDDMGGLIFRCFHRELNGLPWDVEAIVEGYKRYWAQHGL